MPYQCQGEQVVHESGLRGLNLLLWLILVILFDSNLDIFLVTLNNMQVYRFLHFLALFPWQQVEILTNRCCMFM